jgi:hypothetical protein
VRHACAGEVLWLAKLLITIDLQGVRCIPCLCSLALAVSPEISNLGTHAIGDPAVDRVCCQTLPIHLAAALNLIHENRPPTKKVHPHCCVTSASLPPIFFLQASPSTLQLHISSQLPYPVCSLAPSAAHKLTHLGSELNANLSHSSPTDIHHRHSN